MIIQSKCSDLPILPKVLYELFTYEDIKGSDIATSVINDFDTVSNIHTPHTPYLSFAKKAVDWCKRDKCDYTRLLDYIKNIAEDINPMRLADKDSVSENIRGLLESHSIQAVQAYCEQVYYAFKNYRAGAIGYSTHMDKNTRSGRDSEETDKIWRETDEFTENILSVYDFEKIRARIPALMLSVHKKVKTFGLLGMSVVRAVYLSGTTSLKAGNLLAYGMYKYYPRYNKYLKVDKGFDALGNKVIAWLNGSECDLSYRDLKELIYLLHKVDIDMENLDPLDFDDDYFKNLTMTYITPNNELIARVEESKKNLGKPYSELVVRQALASVIKISISAYLDGNQPVIDFNESVQLTSNFLRQHTIDSNLINYEAQNFIIPTLKFYTKCKFNNGILCYQTDMPALIDITKVVRPGLTTSKFALYHQDGTICIIDDNPNVFYIIDAATYKKYFDTYTTKNIQNWGVWQICKL